MISYDIKCHPQYFERVLNGTKTFEVRDNDRGYQSGDEVIMREWNPKLIRDFGGTGIADKPAGYTGRQVTFKVGYVLPIDEKRVVFSILELKA